MLHEKEMRSVDAEGLSCGFLQVKKQAGKKKSSALVGIEPTPGGSTDFESVALIPGADFKSAAVPLSHSALLRVLSVRDA